MIQVLHSVQDESVNFVEAAPDGGFMESRFVQRTPEYFIVYLSSQTGCDKACRFCHLTATGQTTMTDVPPLGFARQANRVFSAYQDKPPAEFVNFNFMARGEPLTNRYVLGEWANVHRELSEIAQAWNLRPQFNISTIMPHEIADRCLTDVFGTTEGVTPYYSLYSMEERFRKRWLPKSLAPDVALDKLRDWQHDTGREVVLHWTFIDGQNDDPATLGRIIDAVQSRDLKVRFNLVRYNPYSDRQGLESPPEVLERNFAILSQAFGSPLSRIVPRVGYDVKASCGMFVNK